MKLHAVGVCALLTLAGCQTPQRFVLEKEFPSQLGEPVYLLKPSDFPLSDMMAVWMPRQPPPSNTGPTVTIGTIGPKDTTAPALIRASHAELQKIVEELPAYLPKRAIFLISSTGAVAEVALSRSRDKLNERVFAARLRSLRFEPATYLGKAVAVICEVNLESGAVGPAKTKG